MALGDLLLAVVVGAPTTVLLLVQAVTGSTELPPYSAALEAILYFYAAGALIAHLVADANNPFHISDNDPRLSLSHDDFEQYFERRMAQFPTVFYGLDDAFHLGSYLDRTFARTSRRYPLMSEEYFRGGERRTSAEFDDRSTAFGVASVCYSHAVTDLVNLYYYIWKEAGGDVRSASIMRRGNLVLNAN